MNGDDFDAANELAPLYRDAARERTSPELDAAVLRVAREHARKTRWRAHFVGIGFAAAAMLVFAVGQIRQRQSVEEQSIRRHYAEITLPYLLDQPPVDEPFKRATRYLLDHREFEQPPQSLDGIPVDPQQRGI
jgi:hypothetical protein